MKRIILVSLLLTMAFAVAGCSPKDCNRYGYTVVDGVGVYYATYNEGHGPFYATKQDAINAICK